MCLEDRDASLRTVIARAIGHMGKLMEPGRPGVGTVNFGRDAEADLSEGVSFMAAGAQSGGYDIKQLPTS